LILAKHKPHCQVLTYPFLLDTKLHVHGVYSSTRANVVPKNIPSGFFSRLDDFEGKHHLALGQKIGLSLETKTMQQFRKRHTHLPRLPDTPMHHTHLQ